LSPALIVPVVCNAHFLRAGVGPVEQMPTALILADGVKVIGQEQPCVMHPIFLWISRTEAKINARGKMQLSYAAVKAFEPRAGELTRILFRQTRTHSTLRFCVSRLLDRVSQ
jgi:hypothetical protein